MTLDLNVSGVRADAVSRTVEVACADNASEAELQSPTVGAASGGLVEWLSVGSEVIQTSGSLVNMPFPDLEWTDGHERRFGILAGREAVGRLTVEEQGELERLSRLRRGMKNPRAGEELLWEYEQRELTRNLIKALDQYVSFHKFTHRAQSAEA